MQIRRYVAIITALSLCGSGLQSMQSLKKLCCSDYFIQAGLAMFGGALYGHLHDTYFNTYSITYNKKEVASEYTALIRDVTFDNVKLKKCFYTFTLDGFARAYVMDGDAVRQVIRSELAAQVVAALKAGNSVIVKLSNDKTVHFIGGSHTEQDIMDGILDVLFITDQQKYAKSSFKE